jgi:hypothetical protein
MIRRAGLLLLLTLAACGGGEPKAGTDGSADQAGTDAGSDPGASGLRTGRWRAAVTNGFKGDSLFFTVAPDGRRVTDVEFKGYWRCREGGTKLMDTGHPPGDFPITGDSVSGEQRAPYLLWTLQGRFVGRDSATGTFRTEYHTECDTYKLTWVGEPA